MNRPGRPPLDATSASDPAFMEWHEHMNEDNIDLLVERLHALVDQLRDPAYVGHDKHDHFVCECAAHSILFAMYGGRSGHEPVPSALSSARIAKMLIKLKQVYQHGRVPRSWDCPAGIDGVDAAKDLPPPPPPNQEIKKGFG